MKFLVPAALALGLAVSGAAVAQTAGAPGTQAGKPDRRAEMIKAMDKDGDGKVSKAEFLAFQPQGGWQVDANKDGKVTRDEFMTPRSRADSPRAAEWKARAEKRRADAFSQLDANKDGMVSREEFTQFRGGLFVRTAADRDARAGKMQERKAAVFQRMDANADGAIDAAERQAVREAGFARMDKNGDGFVTADELGRGHRRGHRGHH